MLATLLADIHQTAQHQLPDLELVLAHPVINGFEGRQELLLPLEVSQFALREELYRELLQGVDCVHRDLGVRVAASLKGN